MPGNSGRPKKRPTNNLGNHSKYEICLKENAVVKFAFSESESFWTKTEHVKVHPIRNAKCSTFYRVGIKLLDRKNGNVVKYSQCYKTSEEAELAALQFRIEVDCGKRFFQRKDISIKSSTQMTSICTATVLAIDPEILAKRESIFKQLRDGTLPPLAKYMLESMEHTNSNYSYTLAELKKVHEELTLLNDEDNQLFWTNTCKPSLFHRADRNKWIFRVFHRKHGKAEVCFDTEELAIAGALQFRITCEMSGRKIRTSPFLSVHGIVDALRVAILDSTDDEQVIADDLKRVRQYRLPVAYESRDLPRPEEAVNEELSHSENSSDQQNIQESTLNHCLSERAIIMSRFASRLNFKATGTDEDGKSVRLSRCGDGNICIHKRKEFNELEKERILRIGVTYGIMDVRNAWTQKQKIAKVASTLISYDSGFELRKEIDYSTYQRWEQKINKGIETSTTTCLKPRHKGSKSTISMINDHDGTLMHYIYRKAEKKYLGRGTFTDLAQTMTHLFRVDEKTKNNHILHNVTISKDQLRDWFIENNGQGVSDVSRPLLTDELKKHRKDYCARMIHQLSESDDSFKLRVHTDEKWFYIRSGRQRVKRLPKASFEDENVESFYRRKERSRRHVEKVSWLFSLLQNHLVVVKT